MPVKATNLVKFTRAIDAITNKEYLKINVDFSSDSKWEWITIEGVFSDDVAWIRQVFRDVGFDAFQYSYFEDKTTMIVTLPFEE